ncbi:gamma-glutamylcyclotransferase [Marinobacterium zhoushanense]|uniref:Gamma-glutamylcyclotransferase n=1 Tax=Marinobacterium zhoushanense TaxID=1679163 RepID=A0ABQ1K7V3_9GAMM|nr:gamma-glutamylcyclotransferase [Marinobacterium zhoushanense]
MVGRECLSGFALYDLGHFPAAVRAKHTQIVVELYEVQHHHIEKLDRLEWYYPENIEGSLYIREQVQTSRGASWLYIYNQYLGDTPRVTSGDWAMYYHERS